MLRQIPDTLHILIMGFPALAGWQCLARAILRVASLGIADLVYTVVAHVIGGSMKLSPTPSRP